MATTKLCKKCNTIKGIDNFHRKLRGRQATCKECANRWARTWRKDHPDGRRRGGSRSLWLNYRMTQANFDGLLAHQGGACALCGTTNPAQGWNVDHDHATGGVRGILCQPCNTTLGRVEAMARRAGRDVQDVCQGIPAYLSGPQYGND